MIISFWLPVTYIHFNFGVEFWKFDIQSALGIVPAMGEQESIFPGMTRVPAVKMRVAFRLRSKTSEDSVH